MRSACLKNIFLEIVKSSVKLPQDCSHPSGTAHIRPQKHYVGDISLIGEKEVIAIVGKEYLCVHLLTHRSTVMFL